MQGWLNIIRDSFIDEILQGRWREALVDHFLNGAEVVRQVVAK